MEETRVIAVTLCVVVLIVCAAIASSCTVYWDSEQVRFKAGICRDNGREFACAPVPIKGTY